MYQKCSNAASQTPHDVSSYYPHTASSTNDVGLRHINLMDLSSIANIEPSIQSFHHNTCYQFQSQEEHYPEHPVN